MRIIVVGANGFIGSHLVARLERDGHEVQSILRGNREAFLRDPHAIINCAGQVNDRSKMYRDNVTLVYDLLESLRGERFIQIGSSSETGPVEGPRGETMICRPSDVYEHTKLAATSLCLAEAVLRDLDVVVARPFTVYGPHDKPRMMLPTLWRAWKDGTEFVCHPGGHDWIYIDDFLDGIVALLRAPRSTTKGQIYHFGTGVCTSNAEVIDLFNREAGSGGVRVRYSTEPFHPYDVKDWRADITKARTVLRWSPKVTIQEGIKRFVNEQWFTDEKSSGL